MCITYHWAPVSLLLFVNMQNGVWEKMGVVEYQSGKSQGIVRELIHILGMNPVIDHSRILEKKM